jgi:GNAT superfamily N-acetyltransferase
VVSPAPPNWQLRPLLTDDADAVTGLISAAFARMELPLTPPPVALSETAQSIAERIGRGGGAGVTVDDTWVGSVLWAVDEGLYVSRLAVSPAWRRRGIGASLLHACETEARRRGQMRLHLETRLVLAGNLRLFGRLGYREFARNPPASDRQTTLVKLEKLIS